MRLRNVPHAREFIAESPFVVHEPETLAGKWASDVFQNDHPIHLEIGTGKGRFIMALAAQNPDINYIGIEKYSSVLLRLIQKQEEQQLENLRLIQGDAQMLKSFFGPAEISRIYLNFSDPWPKDRHAMRRLPSREFLSRYDYVLTKDGTIEFKTDQQPLFDFALEELKESAFQIRAMTRDLHADEVLGEGNIMTEYEERFSALGNPIYKYILEKR